MKSPLALTINPKRGHHFASDVDVLILVARMFIFKDRYCYQGNHCALISAIYSSEDCLLECLVVWSAPSAVRITFGFVSARKCERRCVCTTKAMAVSSFACTGRRPPRRSLGE